MLFKWLTFISSYQTSQIKNEECKGEEEIWIKRRESGHGRWGIRNQFETGNIFHLCGSAGSADLLKFHAGFGNRSQLMSTIWQHSSIALWYAQRCCRNYYPTLVQHLFSIFTTSVMSHRGCSDIFTGIPAARISTDAASADRLDEWNQSAREYWSGFAADWHFEHKRSICCTFRSLFQNFSSASRFWLSIVSFPEPSSKRNRAVMRAYNLCEHRLLIHSQYQHQRVVT